MYLRRAARTRERDVLEGCVGALRGSGIQSITRTLQSITRTLQSRARTTETRARVKDAFQTRHSAGTHAQAAAAAAQSRRGAAPVPLSEGWVVEDRPREEAAHPAVAFSIPEVLARDARGARAAACRGRDGEVDCGEGEGAARALRPKIVLRPAGTVSA